MLAWVQGQWWWLSYLTIFGLAFGILLALQASTIFPDPDSFYHVKMAVLIRDQGIIRDFPWLDLTILGQHYTDQHFLYHVALIPFVTWLPPLVGIKMATVVFGATLAAVCYWFLRQFGVRWAFVFVLILFLTRPFTFRISLAKASSTSLILLFLGLGWIFNYHLRRVFALAFVYVWWYGGFPLLGIAAALYSGTGAIVNRLRGHHTHRWVDKVWALLGRHKRRFHTRSLNLSVLAATLLGLAAGVIVNPFFPDNLIFYFHQLVNIGIINFRSVIGVGGEWYAYGFGDLVANGAFASLLILLALLGMVFRLRAQSKQTWTMMILTIFFFGLTLKSRRYVEYYIPTAILFSGLSLSDSLGGTGGQVWRHEFSRLWLARPVMRHISVAIVGLLFLAVGFIAGRDFWNEYQDVRQGFPADRFAASSRWLAEHTPVDSHVVHSDWDEFPVLFYQNTHNRYIVGLDPTFLYKADPAVYWTWVDITLGRFKGNVYEAVTTTLRSRYVFVASGHDVMQNLIEHDPRFALRYEDAEARIYEAK